MSRDPELINQHPRNILRALLLTGSILTGSVVTTSCANPGESSTPHAVSHNPTKTPKGCVRIPGLGAIVNGVAALSFLPNPGYNQDNYAEFQSQSNSAVWTFEQANPNYIVIGSKTVNTDSIPVGGSKDVSFRDGDPGVNVRFDINVE